MKATNAVLIIDDDELVRGALAAALAPAYTVHLASSGEEGLTQYERHRPDVVLLDVMLPQMSGIAVLRALKRMCEQQPVIMMTGYAEVQTAVQAIKLGAVDYLQKPVSSEVITRELEQVLARRFRQHDAVRDAVLGESAAMKRAWRLVERFGPTDMSILIQGETGTGKGLIAQAIHRVSKRAHGQFVGIDCATIPEQLAESELFGYEDGAFTGAGKRRRGRVAFADRGTLFLDEIGTLALATQAKLLTLIEQQQFLPLGARSAEPMRLDVRFLSATNVPLQNAVADGTFRADLFYRLNGITIELPPLRDRDNDIDLLARHFAREGARQAGKLDVFVADDAMGLLREYGWPGNVRELQRVMSAAAVLADDVITADDLPEQVRRSCGVARAPIVESVGAAIGTAAVGAGAFNLREIKEAAGREAQKRVIQELQKRSNISRQDMARMLGVDPKTLRSRLREM